MPKPRPDSLLSKHGRSHLRPKKDRGGQSRKHKSAERQEEGAKTLLCRGPSAPRTQRPQERPLGGTKNELETKEHTEAASLFSIKSKEHIADKKAEGRHPQQPRRTREALSAGGHRYLWEK